MLLEINRIKKQTRMNKKHNMMHVWLYLNQWVWRSTCRIGGRVNVFDVFNPLPCRYEQNQDYTWTDCRSSSGLRFWSMALSSCLGLPPSVRCLPASAHQCAVAPFDALALYVWLLPGGRAQVSWDTPRVLVPSCPTSASVIQCGFPFFVFTGHASNTWYLFVSVLTKNWAI